MIYANNIFEMLSSMIGHKKLTKSNGHFTKKTPYMTNG